MKKVMYAGALLAALVLPLFSASAQSAAPSSPGTAAPPSSANADAAATARPSAASAADLPRFFYKHLVGSIDSRYPIVMNLFRADGAVFGDYAYRRIETPIDFLAESSIDDHDTVRLVEWSGGFDANEQPSVSGRFDGRFVDSHTLKGTWSNASGTLHYPFVLTEDYTDGAARFFADDLQGERDFGDSAPTTIEIDHPRDFWNDSDTRAAERAINLDILAELTATYDAGMDSRAPAVLSAIVDDFLANGADNESWATLTSWIVVNTPELIGTETELDYSTDPMKSTQHFYRYGNFEAKSGRAVSLDELLAPGYASELDRVGESAFRRQLSIPAGRSLEDVGFSFPDGRFALPRNVLVTRSGLQFEYEPYEITALADSRAPIKLFIPYDQIRALIPPGGLLARFAR